MVARKSTRKPAKKRSGARRHRGPTNRYSGLSYVTPRNTYKALLALGTLGLAGAVYAKHRNLKKLFDPKRQIAYYTPEEKRRIDVEILKEELRKCEAELHLLESKNQTGGRGGWLFKDLEKDPQYYRFQIAKCQQQKERVLKKQNKKQK